MPANQAKNSRRKKRIWGIVFAVCLFIFSPLLVLSLAIDNHALVVATASVDANSAGRVKTIARQLRDDIYYPKGPSQRNSLMLTEDEINGIIALGMRGIKGFKGRMNVTPIGVNTAFTLNLPSNPFGEYLNLSAMVLPSETGLVVQDVSMGSIKLPGGLFVSMTEFLLNRLLTGDKTGTKLIQSIESISVHSSKLLLVYHTIPNMKQIFEHTKSEVKSIRDDMAFFGSTKPIKFYYLKLCDYHKEVRVENRRNISLGLYLSTVFHYARKRSLIGEDPVVENRSALLALAIFLGTTNFNSIVGAIDKPTIKACQPSRRQHVALANRVDLRLHFIYSAGLKIISDSGMSFAIGEFKELLDSQEGGSGFSYADLAADRAGIRFAERALDYSGALRVQQMAAELLNERTFFPSIDALPENIPQQTFEMRGGIESEYYNKYLKLINTRINQLSLYQ